MSANKKLLEVKGLKKHFPTYSGIFRRETGAVKAVDGIDFSIGSGEVLGMVGESGCGKSTTGRLAIRLIEPTAGSVTYAGENILEASPQRLKLLRRELQIVFQDPYSSLNPRKTVGDSVGEALLVHGLVDSVNERNDCVAETLRRVGLLPDVMNRYPHEFSGGQQQRICIARAIIMKPKLIICDEAVSALDVSVQAQILNLLHELKEEMSLSYLFISHDLSVVRHISDRVLVMYFGKIVETNTAEALFADPQHDYTKKLLASEPCIHPRMRRTPARPEQESFAEKAVH
jgi:ABC-type oligopeptide transport system ATPase subunit